MSSKWSIGIAMAAVVALGLVGCKKKPKGESKSEKGDTPAAMRLAAMRPAAMRPAAMRPAAMRPAAMTVVALKMDKTAAKVVIPRGMNPLAGIDISKGFGEGWFKRSGQPGMAPPAGPNPTGAETPMGPTSPVAMAPDMAPVMAPAGMGPAPMGPAPTTARPRPAQLPYTRYVHPDNSFAFRHPTGWTPKVKVGAVKGVPTFVIQVRKDPNQAAPGELGALAFVLPKKAPDSKTTCNQLLSIIKKSNPTLKHGPLKPFQKTGLYMLQAMSVEGGQKLVSMAFCGTAHGRIMLLSYFTVGQRYANYNYGYQLGVALYTFTSDLLKK